MQLAVIQLWALVAGGPLAMVITAFVGILINNSVTGAKIEGIKSDLLRVEGVLSAKLDALNRPCESA